MRVAVRLMQSAAHVLDSGLLLFGVCCCFFVVVCCCCLLLFALALTVPRCHSHALDFGYDSLIALNAMTVGINRTSIPYLAFNHWLDLRLASLHKS